MGITVADRASLHLSGTTVLSQDRVLALMKETATAYKASAAANIGMSLSAIGAHFVIAEETPTKLGLAWNTGKDLIEMFTLSVKVSSKDGVTQVRVGGLETYKTSQETLLGFIPVSPKMVTGMQAYKDFLKACEQKLLGADPQAQLGIAQVGQ